MRAFIHPYLLSREPPLIEELMSFYRLIAETMIVVPTFRGVGLSAETQDLGGVALVRSVFIN